MLDKIIESLIKALPLIALLSYLVIAIMFWRAI